MTAPEPALQDGHTNPAPRTQETIVNMNLNPNLVRKFALGSLAATAGLMILGSCGSSPESAPAPAAKPSVSAPAASPSPSAPAAKPSASTPKPAKPSPKAPKPSPSYIKLADIGGRRDLPSELQEPYFALKALAESLPQTTCAEAEWTLDSIYTLRLDQRNAVFLAAYKDGVVTVSCVRIEG